MQSFLRLIILLSCFLFGCNSKDLRKINAYNSITIERFVTQIKNYDFIENAIQYGSSVFNKSSRDIDIAVFIEHKDGIISKQHYKDLKKIRNKIMLNNDFDLDLVPHTYYEIDDCISTINNPRTNPALVNGRLLKGYLNIVKKKCDVKNEDLAKYVLLDNLTVTRRQIIRGFSRNEFAVFLSKLNHTPGNILTYRSLLNKHNNYYANPSDNYECVKILDKMNPDYNIKKFISKVSKLRDKINDPNFKYTDDWAFENGLDVLNDFELIVYKEFYAKNYKK